MIFPTAEPAAEAKVEATPEQLHPSPTPSTTQESKYVSSEGIDELTQMLILVVGLSIAISIPLIVYLYSREGLIDVERPQPTTEPAGPGEKDPEDQRSRVTDPPATTSPSTSPPRDEEEGDSSGSEDSPSPAPFRFDAELTPSRRPLQP